VSTGERAGERAGEHSGAGYSGTGAGAERSGAVHRLVLFDVDCTLIESHGAGGRAMFRAMDEVYGVRGELDGYSFHGRTDPAIIVDLATRWGAPETLVRAGLARCLARYIECLRDEMTDGEIEVLPGVHELVTALACDRRVVLGVLTGNVADGLAIKLAPTGLLSLFKVQASGSDSALRPELPAVAVARADLLTGRRYTGKEVVVIGDTPADISCGAALGVRAIAVATGRHTIDELAACEPDYAFADLSDWRAVMGAILA
jgi:phosphoglycolate phosphatase-like HAD superfamily hydrolase